jgi:hypothetical protein
MHEWNKVLAKLAIKTKTQELSTACWFPVCFAIISWSKLWIGALMGLEFAYGLW